jgi:hypothetical protein
MRRITKRTSNEFIFEYEDARHMPKIKNGEIFKHERQKYRIVHYNQVFGEQVYCSFLVIAKIVE